MKFIISLAFLLVLSGCDIEFEETSGGAPEKPDSVSEEAIWVGAEDGGVFVDISETEKENIYEGTIYYDYSGEIWYRGKFEYTGDKPFEPDAKSSYSAWDGTHLYLRNQEQLVAVGLKENQGAL